MARKLFIFLIIGLIGFTLSFSLTGCKKHKTSDSTAAEESEDDDSEDESDDTE
jgi:hypothetical protein